MTAMNEYQRYAYEHPIDQPEDATTLECVHTEAFGNYTLSIFLVVSRDPAMCAALKAGALWHCSVTLSVAGRDVPTKRWKPYHVRMARAAADRNLSGVGDPACAPYVKLMSTFLHAMLPLSEEELRALDAPAKTHFARPQPAFIY